MMLKNILKVILMFLLLAVFSCSDDSSDPDVTTSGVKISKETKELNTERMKILQDRPKNEAEARARVEKMKKMMKEQAEKNNE